MQFQFDATTVNPQGDRSAVPEGEYNVILSNTEVSPAPGQPAANGTDRQIKCTYKILDGPLAGQMVFGNIQVEHSNPVAKQIGLERLSAICHCVGVHKISDTAQLHGRPLRVKVTQRRVETTKDGTTSTAIYNDIVSFMDKDGKTAASLNSAPPSTPAPPAWAGAAAPTPPAAAVPAPPTPVAPSPVPAPPAPVAAPELYFVAHNGTNITPQPIPAAEVARLPQGLAALLVCKVGTSAWVPATTIIQAPVQQAQAANVPPWLQSQAQTA